MNKACFLSPLIKRPFLVWLAIILLLPISFAPGAEPPAQAQVPSAKDLATDLQMRTVTIRAQVAPGQGTVYLTGNRLELGNWNPRIFAMAGTNSERVAVLHLPLGTRLE